MESPNNEQIQLLCPTCKQPITEDEYFCPNCGKKLKEKPVSTSIAKQTLVYLVSFFLPPFGLPWAYKYIRQPDQKSKTIGYVAIGLTILSIIINVWIGIAVIHQTEQTLNTELNNPLNSIYTP